MVEGRGQEYPQMGSYRSQFGRGTQLSPDRPSLAFTEIKVTAGRFPKRSSWGLVLVLIPLSPNLRAALIGAETFCTFFLAR